MSLNDEPTCRCQRNPLIDTLGNRITIGTEQKAIHNSLERKTEIKIKYKIN